MPLRHRPKYLPGYSYDQSGGPKSITRQNYEMSRRRPNAVPACPRCHKMGTVEAVRDSFWCSGCDINFIPEVT